MIDIKIILPCKLLACFCMLLLYNMHTTPPAIADASSLPEQKSHEILKQLSLESCNNEITKKWETYLTDYTWFNDEIHQKAIVEAGLKFASSLSILEECTSEIEHLKNQSNSEWIKDFRKEFDKSYTKKNLDSIKLIIAGLSARNTLDYCKEQKKEAIYNEILYREALEDYMQLLERFASTLDTQEREKLEAKLHAADTILPGPPYPLQVLIAPHRQILFLIALKNSKDLDPRLVDFFMKNTFFQKPFNPVKALYELSSENDEPE